MGINSNVGTCGRFGNQFFRNMVAHLIAKNQDLKFEYSYEKMFEMLGVIFFKGNKQYQKTINIYDKNFMDMIHTNSSLKSNININSALFYTT